MRHRVTGSLGLHRGHQRLHVGNVHHQPDPRRVLRSDERPNVGNTDWTEELLTPRRGEPAIFVVDVVVNNHRGHRASSVSGTEPVHEIIWRDEPAPPAGLLRHSHPDRRISVRRASDAGGNSLRQTAGPNTRGRWSGTTTSGRGWTAGSPTACCPTLVGDPPSPGRFGPATAGLPRGTWRRCAGGPTPAC